MLMCLLFLTGDVLKEKTKVNKHMCSILKYIHLFTKQDLQWSKTKAESKII